MICIKPQKHRKVAQQNSPRGECRGGGGGGKDLENLEKKGEMGRLEKIGGGESAEPKDI